MAGINPNASEEMELRIGKSIIPILAVLFFIFAHWAAGKRSLAFMTAPLSSAASSGLLMVVPSIIGAFFWKRVTAAGALSSMIAGPILVLGLNLTGTSPLGMLPSVWGFLGCLVLYILVSLVTTPPLKKAEEFVHYLQETLPKGRFI